MIRNPKSIVSSTINRYDGQPIFYLEQSGSDLAIAKVSSIDYLHKVLEIADDAKLKVLQELIQGICSLLILVNRNPIGAIFFTNSDSAKILSDAFDAVESEKDQRKKDLNIKLYKLLLAVNAFDLQLMQASVDGAKKYLIDDINQ